MHYYQNCNIRVFEGGFHDQPNQMLCGNQEKLFQSDNHYPCWITIPH